MGVAPIYWRCACIVPLYKGKGDKFACSNSRGISLLSEVGMLYGRVLIKKIEPELTVQLGRSSVSLCSVEDALTKCLP